MAFPSGPDFDLARAAAWVFVFGALVASRHLPLRWACLVAAVKVAIPFAYFSADAFGSIHLSDDLDYFYRALPLYGQGMDLLRMLRDPAKLVLAAQALGGSHPAYPLWNVAAFSLFGPHYFAAVFLNVGLSFVAGWCFYRILRGAGYPGRYCAAALCFFLLHWDVLTWSSLLNLKDTAVLTLTLAVLYNLMALFRSPGILRAAGVAALLVPLFFLRFYAPMLLLAAAAIHFYLEGRGMRRILAVVLVAAAIAFLAPRLHSVERFLQQADPLGIPYGVIRFLATPLPWNLVPGYEFLFPSALLHFLWLLPAFAMAPRLWASGRETRLLFVYFAVTVLFYAATPELQGPRQRLQAGFMFAWLQFHAAWLAWRKLGEPSGDA